MESAGLVAEEGHHMCSRARGWLAAAVHGDVGSSHRSRPLTEQLLLDSDLVLVATLRQRKLVASMAPGVIARLFTCREAALLAGHVGSHRGDSLLRLATHDDAVTAFVRDIAGLRGTVRFPTLDEYADYVDARSSVRRRHWWSRPGGEAMPHVSPYDIPDAHTCGHGDHEPTFAVLGPAAREVAGQLAVYVAAVAA